jgi:Mor family transcriptional regulator
MLAGKKIKVLAKQYGVSEMQIYRIKSGENWSHITVD